ncbi:MAG TPA: CxxxxCH/CxxCH domain-containing protein, partial [Vicinamibacteria bacterium]
MRPITAFTLLAAAFTLGACDRARPVQGPPDAGTAQVPIGDPGGGPGGDSALIRISHCTPCHGTKDLRIVGADPLVAVAPPRALFGETDPGLHRSHLVDGTFRRAVECASCHLVPAVASKHPPQAQGKVSFSRLATTPFDWIGARSSPVWNGTTCAGTYCHGNFKNGANAAPTWAAGQTVACGDCHGVGATNGPGGTHPTFSAGRSCGSCHGGAYTTTTVDLDLHMNGAIDAG